MMIRSFQSDYIWWRRNLLSDLMFILFLFINYVCSGSPPDKSCLVDLDYNYQVDLKPLMNLDGGYEVMDEHSDSSFFRLAYGMLVHQYGSFQFVWTPSKTVSKRRSSIRSTQCSGTTLRLLWDHRKAIDCARKTTGSPWTKQRNKTVLHEWNNLWWKRVGVWHRQGKNSLLRCVLQRISGLEFQDGSTRWKGTHQMQLRVSTSLLMEVYHSIPRWVFSLDSKKTIDRVSLRHHYSYYHCVNRGCGWLLLQ